MAGCAQYRYDPLRCKSFEYMASAEALRFSSNRPCRCFTCKRVPLQQLRCACRTHLQCLFTVLVDGAGTTARSGLSDFWRLCYHLSQWYGFEDCFGSTDDVLHVVEKTILTRKSPPLLVCQNNKKKFNRIGILCTISLKL